MSNIGLLFFSFNEYAHEVIYQDWLLIIKTLFLSKTNAFIYISLDRKLKGNKIVCIIFRQ